MEWTGLPKAANPALHANSVSSYIMFESKKKQFLVLTKRGQGIALIEQAHYLPHGKDAVNEADGDNGIWNRASQLYTALRFDTYLNLDHIALVVSNNTLYKIQEGWTGFAQ